jgi:hypothetical protein
VGVAGWVWVCCYNSAVHIHSSLARFACSLLRRLSPTAARPLFFFVGFIMLSLCGGGGGGGWMMRIEFGVISQCFAVL